MERTAMARAVIVTFAVLAAIVAICNVGAGEL
jgi:hypothetical protein